MAILLEEATFKFSQEANCMSDNDDMETIEIKCMADLGIDNSDGMCFYVIKTDGFAFDSTKELQDLIDRINRAVTNPQK